MIKEFNKILFALKIFKILFYTNIYNFIKLILFINKNLHIINFLISHKNNFNFNNTCHYYISLSKILFIQVLLNDKPKKHYKLT